jgi:sporulation protein YlmC with PRC-barrel domain
MDFLQLKQGASVTTAMGTDLGRVSIFIVDPSRRSVTHLVVAKGVLFGTDRIVPVRLISKVEDEKVILAEDIDHEHMPEFDPSGFVDDDSVLGEPLATGMATSLWRYPILQTGIYPAFPSYPSIVGPAETPDSTRAQGESDTESALDVLDRSADVISAGGEKIGDVQEIGIAADGKLSHLVVRLGLLEGNRTLPAHWIDSIQAHRIHLAVGQDALAALPEAE